MHMPILRLTDKEIGTYLVYRMKTNELVHLHLLWLSLNDGDCGSAIQGVPINLVMETLRTANLAWFATVVDENSLQIFDLWRKMFPQHIERIESVWGEVQPHLGLIRRFRNKTAFHADISFRKFFEPRKRILEEAKEIVKGLQSFLGLAAFLIREEHTVDPDLQSRMLGVILDTELRLGCNIRRGHFVETNIIDRSSIFGTWRF